MDFSADVTTALATVIEDFGAGLSAVVPITFGLAAIVMVYHRVKGLIG
jgi:hypothetical protein